MNDKEIPIESFFTILVIIGFLIKVFFNKLFSGPKSGMTIGGYGVVMVAIAGLLFYKISKDNKNGPNILLSKMSDTFIYSIVMILLAVVIYLNSKYLMNIFYLKIMFIKLALQSFICFYMATTIIARIVHWIISYSGFDWV